MQHSLLFSKNTVFLRNFSNNSRPKYEKLLHYLIMHFIIHILLGRNFNKQVRLVKETTKRCK